MKKIKRVIKNYFTPKEERWKIVAQSTITAACDTMCVEGDLIVKGNLIVKGTITAGDIK